MISGWISRRPKLLALMAGLLAGLGQEPVALPWVTLAGLVMAMILHLGTRTARTAAWIGWIFGSGYFAASLFWIVEPFMVDPIRHGWMAPFALAGLAGGLALFWGLATGIARWLAPRGVAMALAWAVCLAFAELARSYVLTGFPWALIGHVWVGRGPMQLAAWIGPLGLTFLTLLFVALATSLWGRRRSLVLGVLVPFAALYGLGLWQGARPVSADNTGRFIRLIQPNAPQHLKWRPDHVVGFFDRQVEFTAAPSQHKLDLIVWPETSVPTTLDRAEGAFSRIAQAAKGTPVVLGIERYDEDDGIRNTLAVLDGDGQVGAIYDKYHLVPFGEYIPLTGLLAHTPFATFVEDFGHGFSPGPGPTLIEFGPLGRALPLICYEAIFPQDVNAAPGRPDWLLQITNDAWFGQISGPYQHLAQARLRAVEQGLPLVRAANTGVSAVIDATGHVLAQIDLGRAGFIDVALPGKLPRTFYARTGDWPALVLFSLLFLGLLARRRRKPH